MTKNDEDANMVTRILIGFMGFFLLVAGFVSLYLQKLMFIPVHEPLSRGDGLIIAIRALPYSWAIGGAFFFILGGYLVKEAYKGRDLFEEYKQDYRW